jgi:hypothetical protein
VDEPDPIDVMYRHAALALIARLAAGHDPAEALAAVRFPLDDPPPKPYHDHR